MNRSCYYLSSELDPLRIEYRQAEFGVESGRSISVTVQPSVADNTKPREPQWEAWTGLRASFRDTNHHAILQIAVGPRNGRRSGSRRLDSLDGLKDCMKPLQMIV